MKISSFIICLLLLISGKVNACVCANPGIVQQFQDAKFIASAKILKITPDAKNEDLHDVEFELIKVYKGQHLTKLKIFSSLRSSCAFLPKENSTWLIFATEWAGEVGFGYCSGSFQIDKKYNLDELKEYPNIQINQDKRLKVALDILDFLSDKKITDLNKYALSVYNPCIRDFKYFNNFENKNRFCVYEISVNTDLSIASIKTLQRFENTELANKLFDCIKSGSIIRRRNSKSIPEKTKFIMVYYFYDSGGKSKSIVSNYEL